MPVGGCKGASGGKELPSTGDTSTSLENICSMPYRMLLIPIKSHFVGDTGLSGVVDALEGRDPCRGMWPGWRSDHMGIL